MKLIARSHGVQESRKNRSSTATDTGGAPSRLLSRRPLPSLPDPLVPGTLSTRTFLFGMASAPMTPAIQTTVREHVPAAPLPSTVTLNGMSGLAARLACGLSRSAAWYAAAGAEHCCRGRLAGRTAGQLTAPTTHISAGNQRGCPPSVRRRASRRRRRLGRHARRTRRPPGSASIASSAAARCHRYSRPPCR